MPKNDFNGGSSAWLLLGAHEQKIQEGNVNARVKLVTRVIIVRA